LEIQGIFIGEDTTEHIYTDDTPVVISRKRHPVPKTYHVHVEHLSSTNALTDDVGYIHQLFSMYP